MPREKENTHHTALKIAPLLFNGDFKLFSDYASVSSPGSHGLFGFAEAGGQLYDASVFCGSTTQMTTPGPHHLYPLHQKSKVVVRTHFLHRCYERRWDTLCPALMFYAFMEKKKNIFFEVVSSLRALKLQNWSPVNNTGSLVMKMRHRLKCK